MYGTKGIANSANIPGAREGGVSWIDSDDNLWLFGGYGYDSAGNGGRLNDLWKFDGVNWTWVSGSNLINQAGVYGAKGIADPGNIPSARAGSVSWSDDEGNFWLLGGHVESNMHKVSYSNDLWKFDGTNWTWVSGSNLIDQVGEYGTFGVADAANVPRASSGRVSWVDKEGNFWVFGGVADIRGLSVGGDSLDELWRFDGDNWAWFGGSVRRGGVYGMKGVAGAANRPGARSDHISWTDNDGNFWLFGGNGYDKAGSYGNLNDLWKYDGSDWTWVSGSDSIWEDGVYGTKRVADSANVPGARIYSVSWTDSDDNLWLFGGFTADYDHDDGIDHPYNRFNDLWKFDGVNWTWVSGSDIANQAGVYGTKGVAHPDNTPGARFGSVSWTDSDGDLWLFGGDVFNDLWKFDGVNWTWASGSNLADQFGVYGTKGVAASANVPGSRYGSMSWVDGDNLWLFGGQGRDAAGDYVYFNDLWKFDGVNWTWVSGSDQVDQVGVYGTKGVAAAGNVPGARHYATSWTDSNGDFWLFGGSGSDYGVLNDLWKFDGTNWTWVSGTDLKDQLGVYGTKGVADAANMPGGRRHIVSWIDGDDNLWLFGGFAIAGVDHLGDLWKFDGTAWTWAGGIDTLFSEGVYGTKGVTTRVSVPGARLSSVSWTGQHGDLWQFGGCGYDGAGNWDSLNDLWKFDGINWTWVSGQNQGNQAGIYGVKGETNSSNMLGSRESSLSWVDSSGNFWLFGGYGFDGTGSQGALNDLWKYDGVNWTWVSGPSIKDNIGVYGTKGVAHPDNIPGARLDGVSWTDGSGNLWLFGGCGYDRAGDWGSLNDLWKFDGTSWMWVSGSDIDSQGGVYGAKGTPGASNVPGVMIMLGWVFVPFYYRSGVFTMPEFLERRFNSKTRWLLSCVSLIAYVVTKVSVTVYAGALVFQALLPEVSLTVAGHVLGPFWIGAFTTVILTGIYTVFGGLRAVVYTDTAQAMILLVGSAFITYYGLKALGGWGELQNVCRAQSDNFALWRPLSTPDFAWWRNPDFPWLGILIASPVVGIWYWCTDQYIVQRTLAAKNLRNARRGALWGGFLKVWPVMIFLVPGLIGYALYTKNIVNIPLDEKGNLVGDQIFPIMVLKLLPQGIRGLVVGGLLAALMSSLSSLFNSCASLFTIDIYEKIKPNASERHLVTVGRIATCVVVVLGMIWIPIMAKISDGGLYKYLQNVQGYLAPPITAVFLLGLFWKRINSHGAMWGLTIGFILGMAKLTIQAKYGLNIPFDDDFTKLTEPHVLAVIGDFNFLYCSGLLFAISITIVIVASLLTKAQSPESISGLTYATATEEQKKENRASWNFWDVLLTVVVLALVVGMYLYFTFWLR